MAVKVLHLINSLCTGGAQVCLRDIVNENAEGFEHYIYTLRPDEGKFSFEAKVYESGYRNYDIRKFFYLVSLCKRLEIDIVHAHLHKASIFALMLKKCRKCKVIVHEHGPVDCKGIDFTFYRLFMKLFASCADRIIAVSEHIRKRIEAVTGVDGEKITVLRNAVDCSVFTPRGEIRSRRRSEYGVDDSFVVGFIGRIRYVKGIDILIQAFNIARASLPNLKLLIVGNGCDMPDFKRMAGQSEYKDDIIFTGFCEKPHEIMQAFDIGAVPSRKDPCPLVIFELMAAGAVIITSGVDGISEIVQDGRNGFICRNTPQALADCIAKAAADRLLLKSVRENAFNTAAGFDISLYRGKIKEIYRRL